MKQTGDIEKVIVITQIEGGYLVERHSLGDGFRKIFPTFEKAISFIARDFCLIAHDEEIKVG